MSEIKWDMIIGFGKHGGRYAAYARSGGWVIIYGVYNRWVIAWAMNANDAKKKLRRYGVKRFEYHNIL